MVVTETMTRERNRRGEGGRLRAEILHAATALLEETGSEQSVTLRAVARTVGISAPSIYAHFPDREAIVDAIIDDAFTDFRDAIAAAIDTEQQPVRRLLAGCSAYLRFAEDRPNRYRILFDRRDLIEDCPPDPDRLALTESRTESFALLVTSVQACLDAGLSTSTDPFGDATAIWTGLHGYATLHARLPSFPWPPEADTLDRIVLGLAHITEEP
jgi:AcrR family transcriptional regulator